MKIKICGMKYNTQEVAALQPDYLGFIFYGKSPRDFEGLEIPSLPLGIKKVGVFVDADLAFAKAKIEKHQLNVIQLHGNESPAYINALRLRSGLSVTGSNTERSRRVNAALSEVEVWKVFSIKDSFDFEELKPYEGLVDAFLFDTKGKEKGGNGYTFDWSVLKNYRSKTPIVLSGGIGLEEIEKIEKIHTTNLPIIALDVNSRFEVEAGLKDIESLRTFINQTAGLKIQNTSAKAEDSFIQKQSQSDLAKMEGSFKTKRTIIEKNSEQFYFYITTNTYNKVLYTGVTVDLIKRIKQHNNKTYKGSFTSKYNVDKLVYFETYKTVAEARARERQIKKWNREWKDNLVVEMNPDWKDLSWML